MVVPATQLHEHLGPVAHDVGEGDGVALGGGRGGAEAEDVGEDDLGVLAGFEGQAEEVDGEEVEEVFVDEARDELVDVLGGAVGFFGSQLVRLRVKMYVCIHIFTWRAL